MDDWTKGSLFVFQAFGICDYQLFQVGHFDGGLATPNDDLCPHDVKQGQWRFTNGKSWEKDKGLKVECIKENEQKLEFNNNEVNGKFKIMSLKWDENYKNPKSLKYKTLANTIENDLMTMLMEKDDLKKQADFKVKVERFKRGSVVVNFKVDYELKDAVIAIPFKLKPENVSDTLSRDFQYQSGILFRRFEIAANSFNGSIVRDHCFIRGCSHKCDYDYEIEDYVCTCPKLLILGINGKICQDPDISENTIIPDSVKIEVLSTTEQQRPDNYTIVNRLGEVTVGDIETTTFELPLPNFTTLQDITTVTTFSANDDYKTTFANIDETTVGSDAGNDDNEADWTTITTARDRTESVITTSPSATIMEQLQNSLTTQSFQTLDEGYETITQAATTDTEENIDIDFEDTVSTVTGGTETNKINEISEERSTIFSIFEESTYSPIRNTRQDISVITEHSFITTETNLHTNSDIDNTAALKQQTTEEATTELQDNDADYTNINGHSDGVPFTTKTQNENDVFTDNEDFVTGTIEMHDDTTKNTYELTINPDENVPTTMMTIILNDEKETKEEILTDEHFSTEMNMQKTDAELTDEQLMIAQSIITDKTTDTAVNFVDTEVYVTSTEITADKITTEVSATDQPLTEIFMEVMDDENAIINIAGMYTIKCNVTQTNNVQVTLQRSPAYSFPFRANNNLDFDGIDLNCQEMGGRERAINLLVDKAKVRGDISRIWEDKVRLIVDSLLIEDISPK